MKRLHSRIPAQPHCGTGGTGGAGHLGQLLVIDVHDCLKDPTPAVLIKGGLGGITRVLLVVDIQAGGQQTAGWHGEVGQVDIDLHRPVLVVGQRLAMPETHRFLLNNRGPGRGVTQVVTHLVQGGRCLNEVLAAPLGGIAGALEVLGTHGDRPRGKLQEPGGVDADHTARAAADLAAVDPLIRQAKAADVVGGIGGATDVDPVLLPLVGGGVGGHHTQGVGCPADDDARARRLAGDHRHHANIPVAVKILGKGFLMVLELTGTKGGPKALEVAIEGHMPD